MASSEREARDRLYERIADSSTLRHGWYGTYTNHGCRCDDCKAAWAEYRRAERHVEVEPA